MGCRQNVQWNYLKLLKKDTSELWNKRWKKIGNYMKMRAYWYLDVKKCWSEMYSMKGVIMCPHYLINVFGSIIVLCLSDTHSSNVCVCVFYCETHVFINNALDKWHSSSNINKTMGCRKMKKSFCRIIFVEKYVFSMKKKERKRNVQQIRECSLMILLCFSILRKWKP